MLKTKPQPLPGMTEIPVAEGITDALAKRVGNPTPIDMWGFLNWQRRVNKSQFMPIKDCIEFLSSVLGLSPITIRNHLKTWNKILWKIIESNVVDSVEKRGRKLKSYKAYVAAISSSKVHRFFETDRPRTTVSYTGSQLQSRLKRNAAMASIAISSFETPVSRENLKIVTGRAPDTISRYQHTGFWRVTANYARLDQVVKEELSEEFLRDNPRKGVFFGKGGFLYKRMPNSYHIRPKRNLHRASSRARRIERSFIVSTTALKPAMYFEASNMWKKKRGSKMGTGAGEKLAGTLNFAYWYNKHSKQWFAVAEDKYTYGSAILHCEEKPHWDAMLEGLMKGEEWRKNQNSFTQTNRISLIMMRFQNIDYGKEIKKIMLPAVTKGGYP